MCPISSDDSTTDPVEHAQAPEPQEHRGLLRVAVGRDDPDRGQTCFSILGVTPYSLWCRPASKDLTQRLVAEGLTRHDDESMPIPADIDAVLIRADYFFDRSALHLLLHSKPSVIVVPEERGRVKPVAVFCSGNDGGAWRTRLEGEPVEAAQLPSGVEVIDARVLPQVYDYLLRKQTHPFIREINGDTIGEIERRTFDLAYKGVTDIVTKYLYPVPAFHATRLAARFGITPNMITSASVALVFAVLWLFATGDFALGLGLGYLMSFLDTLDGKLARVTQTATRFGSRFDHWTDMIHPPFWWLAFWWGATPATPPAGWNEAAAITFLGYIAIRLQEWRFKKRFSVRIHVWRRFDSHFRLITTRRNPNLMILTAAVLFADAQQGVFWVAGWMVASFAIHAVRWLLAEVELRREGSLVSWLEAG